MNCDDENRMHNIDMWAREQGDGMANLRMKPVVEILMSQLKEQPVCRLKGRQEKKVSKEEKEGRHRGRGQDKGGEKEKREKEEKRRERREEKRREEKRREEKRREEKKK
ncbi:hypothetical protein HGM15179_003712 [Zosterops borbonicus]|uniref:Uncharacterized protein n=1 Tax=Zosterops borbonicus TaxID=364589 RepID=A0A8K1LRU7_9PASS|nr:hypothetical protein HGM15179_003712 [Zosterops borbonicus]